jgi:NADPH:quinone reductase-like Zn-dependent oxidoreductase
VLANDIFVMPKSMSFEDGAALMVNYITAHQILFDFGNLRPHNSVLVHMAAGGVGIAATQLCKTVEDVTVFGTASASKHDRIRQNGVTYPIDYRTKDYVEEVRKISPQGVDIVLDPLNGADATKGYKLLKRLGKIIHYGAANVVTGPERSLWTYVRTYLSTRNYNPMYMMMDDRGAFGYHLGRMLDDSDLYRDAVHDLFRLYEAGKINPVIDSIWPYEKVANGMARMHDRLNVGKVLITPFPVTDNFSGKLPAIDI